MAMAANKGRNPSAKRISIEDMDNDPSTTHIGLDGNSLPHLFDNTEESEYGVRRDDTAPQTESCSWKKSKIMSCGRIIIVVVKLVL